MLCQKDLIGRQAHTYAYMRIEKNLNSTKNYSVSKCVTREQYFLDPSNGRINSEPNYLRTYIARTGTVCTVCLVEYWKQQQQQQLVCLSLIHI